MSSYTMKNSLLACLNMIKHVSDTIGTKYKQKWKNFFFDFSRHFFFIFDHFPRLFLVISIILLTTWPFWGGDRKSDLAIPTNHRISELKRSWADLRSIGTIILYARSPFLTFLG